MVRWSTILRIAFTLPSFSVGVSPLWNCFSFCPLPAALLLALCIHPPPTGDGGDLATLGFHGTASISRRSLTGDGRGPIAI